MTRVRYLPLYVHTSLPALHDVGHIAECCPSPCNAPLDLGKEIPSLCHGLTKVHVFVYLFNDVSVFSIRRLDVMVFSLSITLVLLRLMLGPTGLPVWCMSVSVLSSSSGDLAARTRTVPSAKIKCVVHRFM